MNIVSLIIQLISGAVGGNVAGAAMKESSLGTLGNSIAGIVGGGLGGTILQMVMGTAAASGGGLDLQSILANVAGGSVGCSILMAIVGIIKNKMAATQRHLRESNTGGAQRFCRTRFRHWPHRYPFHQAG